jgi:hypothetical protein
MDRGRGLPYTCECPRGSTASRISFSLRSINRPGHGRFPVPCLRAWRMTAIPRRQAATGSYLFERRQVAGAAPNDFLKARERAASEP